MPYLVIQYNCAAGDYLPQSIWHQYAWPMRLRHQVHEVIVQLESIKGSCFLRMSSESQLTLKIALCWCKHCLSGHLVHGVWLGWAKMKGQNIYLHTVPR